MRDDAVELPLLVVAVVDAVAGRRREVAVRGASALDTAGS